LDIETELAIHNRSHKIKKTRTLWNFGTLSEEIITDASWFYQKV